MLTEELVLRDVLQRALDIILVQLKLDLCRRKRKEKEEKNRKK